MNETIKFLLEINSFGRFIVPKNAQRQGIKSERNQIMDIESSWIANCFKNAHSLPAHKIFFVLEVFFVLAPMLFLTQVVSLGEMCLQAGPNRLKATRIY